ncbi:MAG: hypothetical protein J6X28_05320 [Bacilli bacterium]|nr:hypothetical protein [Bacilli bacterium]
MGIKKLNPTMIDTKKQYHLARKSAMGFIKGAGTGLGVAGAINTAFPALIPTFAGMMTGASDLSTIEKIGIGLGLASNPGVQISGLTILGIGAITGALLGGTISLVRGAIHQRKKHTEEAVKTR